MGRRVRRAARAVGLVVVWPVLLVGTGCATAGAAWRSGPAGIPAEWSLRDHLSYGRAGAAWKSMGDRKVAPSDALLRHMYRGVIGYYAGEFDGGAHALDRAWTIAGDRYTKHVSAGAVSLVTSDAALPYYPLTTEWMFIPYYGGLNWLARNEPFEAAVEARRLAALLAADVGPMPPAQLQGVLRYVSGVIFEAAGERQDALVAYRNAAALLGGLPGDTTLASPGEGDVVILIEDGYVGRPAPRSLGIYMSGDELVALTSGNDASRLAAAQVVERRSWDRRNGFDSKLDVGWLTYEVNWSTFEMPAQNGPPLGARVGVRAAEVITGDVSASVREDYDRGQGARLTRAIARTAIRFAAMEAAEKAFDKASETRKDRKKDGKKGGGWGSILLGIGLAASSVTSAAIDQPDLRAWQLLPDRLSVARLRLPVGEHPIEVVRGEEVVSLGTVTITPGGVAVMTHRWWPGGRRGAPVARVP